MSNRILSLCWAIKLPPSLKIVLISMADNASDDGKCWPTIEQISDRTGCHRATVIRAIRALKQAGLLAAYRSNGRKATYQITAENGQNQSHHATSSTVLPVALCDHTSSTVLPNQSHHATKPVAQCDTNHHITIKEPSVNHQARTRDPILPEWLEVETWAMWDRHRKALGAKTWTADAKRLTVAKLEKFRASGHEPKTVIELAVSNGWRGLFEPKLSGGAAPQQRQSANQQASERAKARLLLTSGVTNE